LVLADRRADRRNITDFAVSQTTVTRLKQARGILNAQPQVMNMRTHPIAQDSLVKTKTRAAYSVRLVQSAADLRAAQALRFEVFNLELDEGLVQAYDTGLDADDFDAVCAHLVVEDNSSGAVVGTYRLQTGAGAARSLGYYSQREFDFGPFEAQRAKMVELGRACIHRGHRNFAVLNLLWKGIGQFARDHGARYLVGCSSINSQDSAEGWAVYRKLMPHLAPAAWLTRPHPAFVCEAASATPVVSKIPRLLSAYLAMGSAICGPPALDREFKTIDFLTWLDIESPVVLAMQQRGRFVV
jgi:putative hemolysin